MEFSKTYLEQLASKMSIGEMASHLKMAKSTIYYHLKKYNIKCRSRSEAQKIFIKKNGHQRKGTHHSEDIKIKISESSREYWDSSSGKRQKEKLATLRQKEWKNSTQKKRRKKLSQLRDAPRPQPDELSKFGIVLADFLIEQGYRVTRNKVLTPGHISDIILEEDSVVIELVPPVSVYGEEAKEKLTNRYERLVQELNNIKYNVLIVEQVSNTISRARCQRVYKELLSLKNKSKTIQS